MAKTNVKSYTRNGHTVKAYDRSIKDRIIQAGAALGGISGAAIGYRRGGILSAGKGLLTGAAIGSLPGAFAPNNKEDSKKVAIGLGALGIVGAGVLGAKYGKGLLARKSFKLVSYNPLTAERNMMVALGIKANKQIKNAPKDIVSLDTEIVNRLGMSKISKMNKSIMSFQRKASKPGAIKIKSDLLSLFDAELTPEAKGYLISKSRVNGINNLPGGDEIREKIYKAALDDIDGLYKADAKALKNYKAISKALSDPKISPGEKAAYQAQLGKYSDKFSSKVIIDRLKNLGFKEIDIKEMKQKLGSDGLFSSYTKLIKFGRSIGDKDKTKRKSRLLRNIGLGFGALLSTGVALKYGKPKVASVKKQVEKVVNSTQQAGKAAEDIGDAAKKISNAVEKFGNMVNDVKSVPVRVKQKIQSVLIPSRKVTKQLKSSPIVSDSPSSTVYNGYDNLEDYVANKIKNRKRAKYSSKTSLIEFARKKGSRDKKKEHLNLVY